jgi:hypothetical protein
VLYFFGPRKKIIIPFSGSFKTVLKICLLDTSKDVLNEESTFLELIFGPTLPVVFEVKLIRHVFQMVAESTATKVKLLLGNYHQFEALLPKFSKEAILLYQITKLYWQIKNNQFKVFKIMKKQKHFFHSDIT